MGQGDSVQRTRPVPWLANGFLDSLGRHPVRPALEVGGRVITYQELFDRASAVAGTLNEEAPEGESPLTAVLAARSASAFIGILAALLRGHGYVPLNPAFPAERTAYMLREAGCRALVVDAEGEAGLERLLKDIDQPLVLVFPERDSVAELRPRFPRHVLLDRRQLSGRAAPRPPAVDGGDIAYLLFTSGSTGRPKGVMVSHFNVCRFLDVMSERYQLDESDRLSQMFDLVFDLSVFDIFMAWSAGACVCCPTKDQVLIAADYIRESEITVWFSVPSVAVLLNRLRQLEPRAFPKLRLSLFCGEALPADAAEAWARAAPNAPLENLYGPTEVTLACTVYRWQGDRSLAECENGVVPIGEPLPGMAALIVDENLDEVPPGESGELLMKGPQVALGYWRDPEKTAQAFIRRRGSGDLFYRTGDLVRRVSPQGPLLYLGRIDHQVKINGMRVELGEIEAVLKEAAGVPRVVAVGWPVVDRGFGGVAAFIECQDADKAMILQAAKDRLPSYMVPRELRCIPDFPLTSNGKIDRRRLVSLLENGK